MTFPPQSMSILVVEDISAMRKMIKDSLRMMGLNNVLLAENGEHAVSQLESNRVDLIISDGNMPKMNGMELLRAVRNSPVWRSIPFMMVTGESDRTMVNTAIQEGVTQFLIKPFTYADIQQRVNRIFGQMKRAGNTDLTRITEPVEPVSEPFVHNLGNTNILIIGTATANEMVVAVLKGSHQVQTTTSGEEAIEIAQSQASPDLIITDSSLMDKSGYEICRALKRDPKTAVIPVIFLTEKASASDITRGFKAGCVDFITKPVNATVLQARVATHIQIRQAKEDLRNHIDILLDNARLREDVERMTRHDIKSPLSAIISTSDALLQSGIGNKHTHSALETIRDAGFDALNMVNRTLDLYKMETGTYQLSPYPLDLVKLSKRVMREMRSEADQKRVRLSIRSDQACYCSGEESLCMSLLRNLLKNAIEASPPDETVYIMVNKRIKINLMIHNKGVVPERIHPIFFDKYATANKAQGTGLGTYSAKLMTEVQGGKIRFISNLKSGTVLQVTLEPADLKHSEAV